MTSSKTSLCSNFYKIQMLEIECNFLNLSKVQYFSIVLVLKIKLNFSTNPNKNFLYHIPIIKALVFEKGPTNLSAF